MAASGTPSPAPFLEPLVVDRESTYLSKLVLASRLLFLLFLLLVIDHSEHAGEYGPLLHIKHPTDPSHVCARGDGTRSVDLSAWVGVLRLASVESSARPPTRD